MFIYHVQKSQSVDRILSQASSYHISPKYFFKVHLDIILYFVTLQFDIMMCVFDRFNSIQIFRTKFYMYNYTRAESCTTLSFSIYHPIMLGKQQK
jgi:hypothetical protein